MNNATDPTALIAIYAAAALDRPAREAIVIRPMRQAAQRKFDASPVWARGLSVVERRVAA